MIGLHERRQAGLGWWKVHLPYSVMIAHVLQQRSSVQLGPRKALSLKDILDLSLLFSIGFMSRTFYSLLGFPGQLCASTFTI